jgi:hypothetical protein
MAFRLTAVESRDLTTVRLVGRVGDDAITPLLDTCGRARRPIVLDLSQVTGASEAGVLLLRRLTDEGVHLLGASQYVTLLLAAEKGPPVARPRPRPRGKLQDRPEATKRARQTRRS